MFAGDSRPASVGELDQCPPSRGIIAKWIGNKCQNISEFVKRFHEIIISIYRILYIVLKTNFGTGEKMFNVS